jgi:ribosomal protein S18 acetylase RimI-like enzyme
LPICCARILDRGSPVCCGLAVLQGKWVGLFDIVTHPQRRRQGLANELIRHLVHWAITERSENAYLQVMLDNDAALRLYQKMTFAPSYRYWYRVKE